MEIDYKRSFEKLVEQIKLETKWSKNQKSRSDEDRLEVCDLDNGLKGAALSIGIRDYGRSNFDRGMVCAYQSILELALTLEKGEFFED